MDSCNVSDLCFSSFEQSRIKRRSMEENRGNQVVYGLHGMDRPVGIEAKRISCDVRKSANGKSFYIIRFLILKGVPMTLLMEPAVSSAFERKPHIRFVPALNMDMEELISEIKQLIRRETNLGVQEMRVTLENGRVILSGYCRTFYTKQLAQEAAMKVIGTDELVNEIRVA